jgi:membrane-associated protease RseP (regulator of RpoE activity)
MMSEELVNPGQALRAAAQDVMVVEDVTDGVASPYSALLQRSQPAQAERGDGVRLRGHLLMSPDQAYNRLSARFRPLGYTPLLRQDGDGDGQVVLALPGRLREASQHVGRAVLLLAATVLSCLFVGAQMVEGPIEGPVNLNLLDGWPYAASLLAILGAHEMGHYLVARRLGSPVSLPYFIPMPIGLGTFGAFINMTAPPRNRRHLLAIAAAGPLAGLALTIPILWLGLGLSQVQPLPVDMPYQIEGNSLLYLGLKYLRFGQVLPSNGQDVFIHQVAFAGWVGILVTGLNLLPVGQLDGGHIIYALAGERIAGYLFWIVLALLVGLSILWQGWLLWLLLLFVFGRVRIAPLDDVTQLTREQRLLALAMVVVFVLVFVPIPIRIVTPV